MRLFAALKMYLFDPETWEDVCDRCGLCCYEREISDDGVQAVNLSAPCEFLDTECNLCTAYEDRFVLCDRCHKITPRDVLSRYTLPPTCAYKRRFGSDSKKH